ncbi:MAG TPA: hypothetical protein VJH37_05285 [Candidatus Nanoarchaeia archaeon]|nr:hypothetical protein [Candidatus Nanoarchaeia archaeon]
MNTNQEYLMQLSRSCRSSDAYARLEISNIEEKPTKEDKFISS